MKVPLESIVPPPLFHLVPSPFFLGTLSALFFESFAPKANRFHPYFPTGYYPKRSFFSPLNFQGPYGPSGPRSLSLFKNLSLLHRSREKSKLRSGDSLAFFSKSLFPQAPASNFSDAGPECPPPLLIGPPGRLGVSPTKLPSATPSLFCLRLNFHNIFNCFVERCEFFFLPQLAPSVKRACVQRDILPF